MKTTGVNYLWRISTIRWIGTEGTKSEEYVTATSIEKVWEYLSLDRLDEGVEIEALTRLVPILKNLDESTDPLAPPAPTSKLQPQEAIHPARVAVWNAINGYAKVYKHERYVGVDRMNAVIAVENALNALIECNLPNE